MQAIESLLQNCQVKLPLTEWSCVVVLASCPPGSAFASITHCRRQEGGRPRGSGLNSRSPFYTTTNVSQRRRRAVGLLPRQRSWAAWGA
jgi:hypothetical protein